MLFNEFNTQPPLGTPIVLNEAVLAKHPTLLKCEDIIADILKYYQGNPLKYDGRIIDKKCVELSVALSNHFNFKHITVTIPGLIGSAVSALVYNRQKASANGTPLSPSSVMVDTVINQAAPNAFTFGKDMFSSFGKFNKPAESQVELRAGRYQWKDKSAAPFTAITLSPGFLSTPGITPAEVLSVILHEIGHSFYVGSTLAASIRLIASVTATFLTLSVILVEWLTDRLGAGLSALFPRESVVGRVAGSVYGLVTSLATDILGYFFASKVSHRFALLLSGGDEKQALVTATILGKIVTYISNVINVVFGKISFRSIISMQALFNNAAFDGLGEEKFADAFAAMHGYGENLAAALARMNNDNPYGRQEDTADAYLISYLNTNFSALCHALDVHPSYDSRSMYVIDFLRAEHKKAKSAAQKAFIAEQIKKVSEVSPQALRQRTTIAKAEVAKKVAAGEFVDSASVGVFIDSIKSLYSFGTDAATFTDKIDANSKE